MGIIVARYHDSHGRCYTVHDAGSLTPRYKCTVYAYKHGDDETPPEDPGLYLSIRCRLCWLGRFWSGCATAAFGSCTLTALPEGEQPSRAACNPGDSCGRVQIHAYAHVHAHVHVTVAQHEWRQLPRMAPTMAPMQREAAASPHSVLKNKVNKALKKSPQTKF